MMGGVYDGRFFKTKMLDQKRGRDACFRLVCLVHAFPCALEASLEVSFFHHFSGHCLDLGFA